MGSVAYAPDAAQAPFIPATSIELRKPTKNDLLRRLYDSAINGLASISLEELADKLGVCSKTAWRWRDELIGDRKISIEPGRWFHRQRVYRVHAPPSKPPSSEKMSNDMSNDKSPVFSDFRHCNIESIERPRSAPPPADLWTRFREAMKAETGQTLSNMQIGVLCRELKRQGMNLWQFWQGLAAHPIARARDLGKVLFTIAQNRLGWPAKPKPTKESKAQQSARMWRDALCLDCLSRTCKCERKPA